jgi:glycosyltransferase involved in cell wall biosynthesis
MISMVVPTRNRSYSLRLVAPSYYEQEKVSEIIFVSDAGDDDTPSVVESLAQSYPATKTVFICNPARLGAAQSRNVGVGRVTNGFTLFCDDDEYLEPGYAKTCLGKLLQLGAGAVSGRNVYMVKGETPQEAVRRFGHGLRYARPFRKIVCEYVNGAIYEGDLELPFTHAIILTRTELLRRFPFDAHYVRGGGYREETDYQMNLFVNGYQIFVTNDCHCIHLPSSTVRTGGQRTRGLMRLYWAVLHNSYFLRKYFDAYSRRVGVSVPRWVALGMFAILFAYREFLFVPMYHVLLPLGLKFRTARRPPARVVLSRGEQ